MEARRWKKSSSKNFPAEIHLESRWISAGKILDQSEDFLIQKQYVDFTTKWEKVGNKPLI